MTVYDPRKDLEAEDAFREIFSRPGAEEHFDEFAKQYALEEAQEMAAEDEEGAGEEENAEEAASTNKYKQYRNLGSAEAKESTDGKAHGEETEAAQEE